ncbi:MAG: carboxylating nicotinate-nucleotide diphosphorylase [Actinobacteria bacterium]|nr:carboxylating nicotinate-nucleotide diphosphorylase [Actinomycetota bacterium]
MYDKLIKEEVSGIIRGALEEDLAGFGDITSRYLIPPGQEGEAYVICKETEGAILSGLDVSRFVFEEVDRNIKFKKLAKDGDPVKNMLRVAIIKGATVSLLKAERTALNFLQHMSGIATLTARFCKIALQYNVKITDTRKTKPCLRSIEKYAVRCGGGFNHRFGLFDGILIKDNHILASGGVLKAIEKIRGNIPHTLKIEVEVQNFVELDEAISAQAEIIMLDNMDTDEITRAVDTVRRKRGHDCLIEVSGNVNLHNIEEVCKTGVDIISIGALTHSAKAVDFSLEFIK